jgi:hypothetical protein
MFTDFVTECREEAIKTRRNSGLVNDAQQTEQVLNELPERIAVAA